MRNLTSLEFVIGDVTLSIKHRQHAKGQVNEANRFARSCSLQNARGISTTLQSPIPTYIDAGMSDAACKMLCASKSLAGVRVSEPEPEAPVFLAGRHNTPRQPRKGNPEADNACEGIQKQRETAGGELSIGGSNWRGEVDRPDREYSIGLAKSRLNRCAVGLLEEWEDTKTIMKHWFPWMEFK